MTDFRVEAESFEPSDRDEADAELHGNQLAKLDRKEREDDLQNRRTFSTVSFCIMQSWVGFIIVITIAQFSLSNLGIGLRQNEFIAVVTTTTASVFGFAYIVGKYLFPEGGSDRRSTRD